MREITVEGTRYWHDFESFAQLLGQFDPETINVALSWYTDYGTVEQLKAQIAKEGERVDVVVAAMIRWQLESEIAVSVGYPATNVPDL